jgi:hypothetical protein
MHPLKRQKMPLMTLRQMTLQTTLKMLPMMLPLMLPPMLLMMKLKFLTDFRSRPSPVPGQQPPQSIKFSFS